MNCKIYISQKENLVMPAIIGEITLVRQRQNVPSCLTFTVSNDTPGIVLGTNVKFMCSGIEAFSGFIFKVAEMSNIGITVTAYDSLRYLKNKATYTYKSSTASNLIRTIAADNMLLCGEIEDSGFVIPWRIEQNKSYLDIIASALDITFKSTGKLFVMYDSKSKLCLKNVESLKSKVVISSNAATGCDYLKSMDSEVYNSIVLTCASKKMGNKYYRTEDKASIARLGLLEYSENIGLNINGEATAKSLLEYYNRVHKSYRFTVPFGDILLQGGSIVTVDMPFHDSTKPFLALVGKVVHRFSENLHFMEITTE